MAKDFIIKNGVLEKYTSNDTSITIPDSVTRIGSWAFSGCSGLTSITIPASVIEIWGYAFSVCTSLASIMFQGTKAQWNDISKDAFWNAGISATVIHCTDGDIACTPRTDLTLPDSVTRLMDHAFANCFGITRIAFDGTMAQWNAIEKDSLWNSGIPVAVIHCTDGDIAI